MKENVFLNSSLVNGASFIIVLQFAKFFSKSSYSLGISDAMSWPLFVKYLLRFLAISYFSPTVVLFIII